MPFKLLFLLNMLIIAFESIAAAREDQAAVEISGAGSLRDHVSKISHFIRQQSCWLDLSKWGLKDLEGVQEIPNAQKIYKLKASYNNFYTGIGKTVDLVPLVHLRSLKVLDLSHNKLCSIDLRPLFVLRKLQILRLDNNELEHVDLAAIRLCPDVLMIDLSFNRLKRCDLSQLPPKLQILTLRGNKIREIDLSGFADKDYFVVDLQYNDISSLDLRSLIETCSARDFDPESALYLSGNPLSDDALEVMAATVPNLTIYAVPLAICQRAKKECTNIQRLIKILKAKEIDDARVNEAIELTKSTEYFLEVEEDAIAQMLANGESGYKGLLLIAALREYKHGLQVARAYCEREIIQAEEVAQLEDEFSTIRTEKNEHTEYVKRCGEILAYAKICALKSGPIVPDIDSLV